MFGISLDSSSRIIPRETSEATEFTPLRVFKGDQALSLNY